MARGGMYDVVGGGFSRYSTDNFWRVPHFEKMLYDNGQLLFLYTDAWQANKDGRFKQVVEETVTWLQREMLSDFFVGGAGATRAAFYSSLDADSMNAEGHGAEGAFYVWQADEVKALLTAEEFVVASSCFGFDLAPNFADPHEHTQAWQPYSVRFPEHVESDLFASARNKLFAARSKRPRPGLDDKILTSWNALAIKGLARAGRVFARPEWVALAQNAVDFIHENLWQNGKLLATCKIGQAAHLNAYLDDYAFLLDALIELLQADYSAEDMAFAEDLAEALLENFEAEDGGFYFTSHSHEKLIHRPKSAYDNATPSGNGIAAVALQRLGHILGEPRYLQAAERALKAFDSSLARNPAACANLCHALGEFLTPPTLIILRGEARKLAAWRAEIQQNYYPHHLFLYLDENAQDLPQTLQRKFVKDVNAWVCKGVACSPSIKNLQLLLKSL